MYSLYSLKSDAERSIQNLIDQIEELQREVERLKYENENLKSKL